MWFDFVVGMVAPQPAMWKSKHAMNPGKIPGGYAPRSSPNIPSLLRSSRAVQPAAPHRAPPSASKPTKPCRQISTIAKEGNQHNFLYYPRPSSNKCVLSHRSDWPAIGRVPLPSFPVPVPRELTSGRNGCRTIAKPFIYWPTHSAVNDERPDVTAARAAEDSARRPAGMTCGGDPPEA